MDQKLHINNKEIQCDKIIHNLTNDAYKNKEMCIISIDSHHLCSVVEKNKDKELFFKYKETINESTSIYTGVCQIVSVQSESCVMCQFTCIIFSIISLQKQ